MSTVEGRGRRILPLIMLVVVAGLVAAAVWFIARDNAGEPSQRATRATPASTNGESGDSISGRRAPQKPTEDGVRLPQGAEWAQGFPVQFPHTDLGAVAAQVAVAQGQVGFDYDQAATIARIYAAPAGRAAFEQRARQAVALRRRQAGVPAHGEVPAPASYAATPVAFTVDELDTDSSTDSYVVNLLSYITLTTTEGNLSDFLYAGTQLLAWTGGDWKLIQPTAQEYQRLIDTDQPQAVAPETPQFQRAGWIRIAGRIQ